MTTENPSFKYSVEGQEKVGEVLKTPDEIWADLMHECKTEKELKELEEHVHLFTMGKPEKPLQYIILTDVKPEGEEMYLSRFGASRTPLDIDIFLLEVNSNKALAKLPPMLDKDKSGVFKIIG